MFESSSSKWAALAAITLVAGASPVHAFCGFYVAGADAELVNDATMVVLMRDGVRTVLSMQNHYQGPPENFAMVVPVPVVLSEDDVKVLEEEIFARVDHLAAPRLVEYWELDPCFVEPDYDSMDMAAPSSAAEVGVMGSGAGRGVTIEAQFVVGEYDIVILSANDSSGLDTWLRENGYSIPAGAEPVLRPYVEAGMKFFVAKVDVSKVRFVDGQAALSPLRFHYDSDTFSLPVRLGLLNSDGAQDLVVHILAPNQRYEMANYENVTVPTNLDVANEVRNRFGEFYAALFDATLERHPRAIVTEYAWQATSCDPCPGPVLSEADLTTLGADVLPQGDAANPYAAQQRLMSFVLTRLHTRYDRDALNEDLVFRAAAPITGGREFESTNVHGASPADVNNFQGRYAIRHEWEGPIECESPVRGRWGGPPSGAPPVGARPATDLAFAPRGGIQLASVVPAGIEALGVAAAPEAAAPTNEAPTPPVEAPAAATSEEDGCGSCAVGSGRDDRALIGLLFIACVAARRRRR